MTRAVGYAVVPADAGIRVVPGRAEVFEVFVVLDEVIFVVLVVVALVVFVVLILVVLVVVFKVLDCAAATETKVARRRVVSFMMLE